MPWLQRRRSREYQIAQGMKDIEAELRYWMQEKDRAREELEHGRKANDKNRTTRAEQRIRRIDERCRQINEVLAFLQEAKDNIRFLEGTLKRAAETGRLTGEAGDSSDRLTKLIQTVSEQMQYNTRSQEKIENQMSVALEMARSSLPDTSSEASAPGPTAEQIEKEQQELERRLRRPRRPA